jgi:hypothetical protein
VFVHGRAPGPRLQPVPWIPSSPWPEPCIPNRPYSHVMNSPTLLTSFVVSQVLVTEYLRQLSAPEINAPNRQIRRVCPLKGDGRIRNSPHSLRFSMRPRYLEYLRLGRHIVERRYWPTDYPTVYCTPGMAANRPGCSRSKRPLLADNGRTQRWIPWRTARAVFRRADFGA